MTNRRFIALILSIVAMFVVLNGLWIAAANAADTRTTVTKNADGSTTTCEYKTAFARINGENVIHKTWRCETSATRKAGK